MIWFIFDLGIGLARFVASAAAFFRARNRPLGSAVAFPFQFPAVRRGRGNVVPARCAVDLTQAVDYTRNYRPIFEAGMKYVPAGRDGVGTPRRGGCRAARGRAP